VGWVNTLRFHNKFAVGHDFVIDVVASGVNDVTLGVCIGSSMSVLGMCLPMLGNTKASFSLNG
jgi:hypothetical protein